MARLYHKILDHLMINSPPESFHELGKITVKAAESGDSRLKVQNYTTTPVTSIESVGIDDSLQGSSASVEKRSLSVSTISNRDDVLHDGSNHMRIYKSPFIDDSSDEVRVNDEHMLVIEYFPVDGIENISNAQASQSESFIVGSISNEGIKDNGILYLTDSIS